MTFGLWSRSLYARVITSTVLVGTVLALGLGALVHRNIASGLASSRRDAAISEASIAARSASDRFLSLDDVGPDKLATAAVDAVRSIAAQGGDSGRYVVLMPGLSNQAPKDRSFVARVSDDSVGPDDVPSQLRAAVDQDPKYQQVQLVSMPVGPRGQRVPCYAVGTRIVVSAAAGAYDLYIFFPLLREQQMLDRVTSSFLTGLGLLICLMALVAVLATRLVVGPIQATARAAQRLTEGDLDERLPVQGTDDLAVLGRSFNRMAETLQQQIRQLEGLSAVQQRFVSDVSHELRTPLTTMHMAADLLYHARADFDPVSMRSAELLHTETDRFESLLADLLEISRMDAGAVVMNRELEDVREIVRSEVQDAEELARIQHTPLVLTTDVSPCPAHVDRTRVARIVRNLVVNAIEHGEGKAIEVSVEMQRDRVLVTVRDHGVGLTAEQAERVFDRFWRGDPARARTTGGTGLGLSIAKEDAALHGGTITVTGAPGCGAAFVLSLPSAPRQGGVHA